jgi:hypothetical protein
MRLRAASPQIRFPSGRGARKIRSFSTSPRSACLADSAGTIRESPRMAGSGIRCFGQPDKIRCERAFATPPASQWTPGSCHPLDRLPGNLVAHQDESGGHKEQVRGYGMAEDEVPAVSWRGRSRVSPNIRTPTLAFGSNPNRVPCDSSFHKSSLELIPQEGLTLYQTVALRFVTGL